MPEALDGVPIVRQTGEAGHQGQVLRPVDSHGNPLGTSWLGAEFLEVQFSQALCSFWHLDLSESLDVRQDCKLPLDHSLLLLFSSPLGFGFFHILGAENHSCLCIF